MNLPDLSRLIPVHRFLGLGTAGLSIASWITRQPGKPMRALLMPAPRHTTDSSLVIVLPGIGDDLRDLQSSGIAAHPASADFAGDSSKPNR